MLRGWAASLGPELGVVAEGVGLNHPAIAASPWRIAKGLGRRSWPEIDPREVEGTGQQGAAWREHLCNHHVCSESLQGPRHACVSASGHTELILDCLKLMSISRCLRGCRQCRTFI